jgi:hypothetical protein
MIEIADIPQVMLLCGRFPGKAAPLCGELELGEAHGCFDFLEGRGRDGLGFCFAFGEDLLEVGAIAHERSVFFADGAQCLYGCFCEQGLKLAPAHGLAFGGDGFFGLVREELVKAQQVVAFWPLRVVEF